MTKYRVAVRVACTYEYKPFACYEWHDGDDFEDHDARMVAISQDVVKELKKKHNHFYCLIENVDDVRDNATFMFIRNGIDLYSKDRFLTYGNNHQVLEDMMNDNERWADVPTYFDD